jgi:hypothetical protein
MVPEISQPTEVLVTERRLPVEETFLVTSPWVIATVL